MCHSGFSVALLAVATLSQSGCHVHGIYHRGSQTLGPPLHLLPAVEPPLDDVTSSLESSKVVVFRGGSTRPNAQQKDVQTKQVAAAPAALRSIEDGVSDEVEDLIAGTQTAIASVGTQSLRAAEATLRVSARKNMDLYDAKMWTYMSHQLRLKSGLKGPLFSPNLHVVNQQVVPTAISEFKDSMPPPLFPWMGSSPFDASPFSLDDHSVLGIVSIMLMGLSIYFNFRPKGAPHIAAHQAALAVDASEQLSVWDGTVTTFSSILGGGVLCLPYAMSLVGWMGAPLLIFFTCCAGYTAHLLTWALQQEVQKAAQRGRRPVMPGWGFLMQAAYGYKGERFVNIFLVVELWGYVLSGVVATAMNFNHLVDGISVSTAIGITVLWQFIFTTVSMKTLVKLNGICNILFVVCCAMFIVTGLLLPTKTPASDLKMVRPEGILASCGIMVFSPAAHALYPAIMQRMEQPEKYPMCLRRAYLMACLAYVGFAVAGYYLFGNATQPSAVRNIGVDRNLVALPNLGWMNYVAAFSMLMKVSGIQPLILKPLTATIENMLADRAPRSVLSTLVLPGVLTTSAVVAMHFMNQTAALLNLLGSIVCMCIAFVLPVLCYWKLSEHRIGALQQIVFTGLIIMGATFAFLGFITALDV